MESIIHARDSFSMFRSLFEPCDKANSFFRLADRLSSLSTCFDSFNSSNKYHIDSERDGEETDLEITVIGKRKRHFSK